MKRWIFGLFFLSQIIICASHSIAQPDTSSYFPLGLWGIWIYTSMPPFNPMYLTGSQWDQENNNWANINSNYMVAWLPVWVEDTVMSQTEPLGYKIDIARSTHGFAGQIDTSLRAWLLQSSVPLSTYWKSRADNKINGIYQKFGDRQGFYSYFLAHEGDFVRYDYNDTNYWPAIGYIIDQIKQVDSLHKSYAVHWGSRGNPPFPFGITLSQFAQRFPNLGIYEVDDYVFNAAYDTSYSNQQSRLDLLLSTFNDCMVSFRNSSTEWHPIIQTQRSYKNGPTVSDRRPILNELRVQAYLALSRGAKGISSFVYGSAPPPPPTPSQPVYGESNQLLSGGNGISSDIYYYDGLVDKDRIPFTEVNDRDHIPGFYNLATVYAEIKPIGPILRKLRIYNAFSNNNIPSNNSAKITAVSGDKIEIGTFKYMSPDSADYFMLVNRVLNGSASNPTSTIPAGSQTVIVTFNRTSGTSWEVEEVLSHNLWIIPYNGSFTDVLDPGTGKLYKIAPALWSGTKTVTSNTAVQTGATLTVSPGTHIMFNMGKYLSVLGKLIAKGDPNNHIRFTSSNTSPSPGDWQKILFYGGYGGGPDTLSYCDIEYAQTGIYFLNPVPYNYLNNVTISNSSENGVQVYSTGNENTTLKMYKCTISDNVEPSVIIDNAKVSISSSKIENNHGIGDVAGVYITSAARVYLDSSRVQNNLGSGIFASGPGTRVSLSPDEIQPGYNTIYQNLRGEIWIYGSATAMLGYTTQVLDHCNCPEAPPGEDSNIPREGTPALAWVNPCPDGCTPVYRYEARAGWNNVYNTYTYTCRLIDNGTSNPVSARYNYWGTGNSMFCGSVDTTYRLGSPVFTPSKTSYQLPIVESFTLPEDRKEKIKWLKQLKKDVEANAVNAIDALHQLALYVGPGGEYSDALPISWDNFLNNIDVEPNNNQVKKLASVFKVQAKMDRGEFSEAITLANQMLTRTLDDDRWLYFQTRKIIASVALGDIITAQGLFNSIRGRGYQIDSMSINNLGEYLGIASQFGARASGSAGSYTQNQTKIRMSKPSSYKLEQNYPNPFNPITELKYGLPEGTRVTFKVYDVLGREVATLFDGFEDAGYKTVSFNASNLPSGVYFYKLQAGSFINVKKMLLLK